MKELNLKMIFKHISFLLKIFFMNVSNLLIKYLYLLFYIIFSYFVNSIFINNIIIDDSLGSYSLDQLFSSYVLYNLPKSDNPSQEGSRPPSPAQDQGRPDRPGSFSSDGTSRGLSPRPSLSSEFYPNSPNNLGRPYEPNPNSPVPGPSGTNSSGQNLPEVKPSELNSIDLNPASPSSTSVSTLSPFNPDSPYRPYSNPVSPSIPDCSIPQTSNINVPETDLVKPESKSTSPNPDTDPSNSAIANVVSSTSGPSGPGPSNPGPSNPGPSNPGPSNLDSISRSPTSNSGADSYITAPLNDVPGSSSKIPEIITPKQFNRPETQGYTGISNDDSLIEVVVEVSRSNSVSNNVHVVTSIDDAATCSNFCSSLVKRCEGLTGVVKSIKACLCNFVNKFKNNKKDLLSRESDNTVLRTTIFNENSRVSVYPKSLTRSENSLVASNSISSSQGIVSASPKYSSGGLDSSTFFSFNNVKFYTMEFLNKYFNNHGVSEFLHLYLPLPIFRIIINYWMPTSGLLFEFISFVIRLSLGLPDLRSILFVYKLSKFLFYITVCVYSLLKRYKKSWY